MDSLPVVVTDKDTQRIRREIEYSNISVLGELVAELAMSLDQRIDFQPDADEARARVGGAVSSGEAHQERSMHPEYPIERVCSHLFEPFQLTFARHAQNVLPEEEEVEVEASHQGLVLRGETEAALEHSVEILQDYYGNQIRIGAPTVRYRNGATVEEPYMGLRVRCSPEYFAAVMADLEARRASIEHTECTPAHAVVRATAPLARLIGYSWNLARLTAGTAHEVMWLSRYSPVEVPPPNGDAV
ncbi:MAG: hypothetical protein ABI885_20500 [Gammaproteobacteria bacterium]